MYKQTKQQVTHLIILLVYTIFIIALTGESILLGWNQAPVMLLLAGLATSWMIHITRRVPKSVRQWLYVIQTMLAFFFYGIHNTSIYDLAPVMTVVIIVYISTEKYSVINLCVAAYFFTMIYDFAFVAGGFVDFTPLTITRTLLHLVLVYMAGWLSKIMIHLRRQERKNTDDVIAVLEETNHGTENFLTNVSHELRTPINVVTGLTSVMLKNETDEAKRKDVLTVQMAGYRLFSQIEDILDYTEIDTGRIKVIEEAYMISSIIYDIIAGMQMKERENTPELIFDIDAGIPSLLSGDGKKIKKMLKHLIDNAVKFTKEGGVYVRIYVRPKKYGINLCIRVSDTGIGMDDENLSKVKERFYQSNGGRNRRAGGLGLGLPIVYGLAAAMEGFLQIESAEGSGTTVLLSIPQKVVDASPCMSVANKESFCLGCYLRPEKYAVPEVRSYYNETITHMVRGLELALHRVFNPEELEELISVYRLTHLFIGQEEYEENRDYFERMDPSMEVVVIGGDSLIIPKGSRIKHIRKPFCCLPVASLLNNGPQRGVGEFGKGHMVCRGVRVLVVDDEPMNLMVAEGILRDYQMQVKTAESGIRALEICDREEFDLVFLDHMMPEMDGVETLKKLRRMHEEKGKDLTIIVFTANAVSGAREMFLEEGFDEFVSKPIEVLELERVLRKVLPKSAVLFEDKKQNSEKDTELTSKDTKAAAAEDLFTQLEESGINMRVGLQYCRGDKQFYKELLAKFVQDAMRKEEAIDAFWKKQDFANYRIVVHALKSSAKMIGAESLSESAGKMEEAAKELNVEYIGAHHENLQAKYKETVRNIQDIFDEGKKSGSQREYQEISGLELYGRLEKIKESLDTFEAEKAKTLIEQLSGFAYCGNSVAGLLEEAGRDVDEFEMTAASEKVKALICSVKDGEA